MPASVGDFVAINACARKHDNHQAGISEPVRARDTNQIIVCCGSANRK